MCRPLPGARPIEPRAMQRALSSSDPTIGVTTRYNRRDLTALSKVSFVLPEDDMAGDPVIAQPYQHT